MSIWTCVTASGFIFIYFFKKLCQLSNGINIRRILLAHRIIFSWKDVSFDPNGIQVCPESANDRRSAILVWLMYWVSKLRNVSMPFSVLNSFSPTSRVIRLVRAFRGVRVVMPALRRCSVCSCSIWLSSVSVGVSVTSFLCNP